MTPDLDAFLDYLERVHARTRRIALLIPDDHLEWSVRPGAMTLGDLVRHLAVTERLMWAETVSGRPSRYASHGCELADGKAAVLDFYDRQHAEAVAIFRALSPQAFAGPCLTPAGASMPVWKWLRALLEHEAHHRGQLYLLLSLIGVPTPPLFGLTSEDVRSRAAH